ncbi:MAG: hypothetical protein R8M46_06510, partial [Ghiorsea sp.]
HQHTITIADTGKATYHRRMSDHSTDERDIDEILASIDEMLNQRETASYKNDDRKDLLQQAAQDSEHKLGLSSTHEPSSDEINEEDQTSENIHESKSIAEYLQDDILNPVVDDLNNDILEPLDEDPQNEDLLEDMLEPFVEDLYEDVLESTDEYSPETDLEQHSEVVDKTEPKQFDDEPSEVTTTDEFAAENEDNHNFDEASDNEHASQEEAGSTDDFEITEAEDSVETNPEQKIKNESQEDTSVSVEQDNIDTEPDHQAFEEGFDDEEESDEIDSHGDPEHSVVTPRHRILLTEALLEPSAQEALPLWIEQDGNGVNSNVETEEITSETNEEPTPEDTLSEPESDVGKYVFANDDVSDTYHEASEDEIDESELTLTSSEAESIESESLESQLNQSDSEPETNDKGDSSAIDDSNKDSNTGQESDNIDQKVESIFEEIASDDSVTFDVSEDLGIDTVYKLEAVEPVEEVENTELVEAMMVDILGERDAEQAEEDNAEQDTDTTSEPSQTPSLDDERIESLVDAVSNDIANQLQDQFQMALRNLVRDSIHKHLEESGFTTKPDSSNHTE